MKIAIVGAGEVGSHLAKMLRSTANDVTVIDPDPQRLSRLSAVANVSTLAGSPTSIEVLREAGVDSCDLFIAVVPMAQQEINILSALLAKRIGAAKVIARINDENYLKAENKLIFKEMGIELMFYPEKMAADEIVDSLRHNQAVETMDFAHGRLQISVFKIQEESPVLDIRLGDIGTLVAPEEAGEFRIIAVSRGERTIIPHFDTKLQFGDIVFTICKRDGSAPLLRLFGQDSVEVDKVMIFGGSNIAEMVARSLYRQVGSVKILEADRQRCIDLAEKIGNMADIANGDGRNSDFLLEEGIHEYDAFVALTGSDETNVLACIAARKFGVRRTIAEVENIEYVRLAEDMGIDTVINKKLTTAGRIFKFTLSGKARFVRYMSGTSAEILEYTVAPGSRITKAPLRELDFPEGAIVGGGIRGSESFIAVGDTAFEAYDRVIVFADSSAVKAVDSFFK